MRGLRWLYLQRVKVDSFDLVPRSIPVPHAFLAFQVDKPVAPVAGSVTPRYPEDLRARRVSGCVLAEFVVDTTGRVDMSTLELLAYNERGFVEARRASPSQRHHA